MPDAALVAMLDRAGDGKSGIGGTTRSIRVADTPVFVKLVRLTDRELTAGAECTANLFDLPTWYQYGVGPGSTGFNAWREVATHQIVTDWVLEGACSNFPLLYHWRVLPRFAPDTDSTATTDINDAVRFWDNTPAVETRLRALNESTAVIALFLEHVPYTLRDWLIEQLAAGPSHADNAVTLVEQQLLGTVGHMRAAGITHFDAHFANVLTDGHRIYLADFGLATGQRFQLDSSEQLFVRRTADHDLGYCAAALVNAITAAVLGLTDPRRRNDYIRRCAGLGRASGLDGVLADTLVTYAPVATAINDFYWQLYSGNVNVEYPAVRIATALRDAEVSL